ncbi:MAG: hypothetical protein KBS81_08400, partial [Spirochaetales bacterium]|nr:hypothetical protein [Candidatus Physcosoma equi]
NLHKVYSIWIVTAGKHRKNSSLSRLALAPKGDESFLREFHVNYDFMEILFMYVGDDWAEWYNQNQSLSLLGLYLDNGRKTHDKCKELKERFQIPMSNELVENVEDQSRICYYYIDYIESVVEEFERRRQKEVAELQRLAEVKAGIREECDQLNEAKAGIRKECDQLNEAKAEQLKETKRLDAVLEEKRKEIERLNEILKRGQHT